jgi:hypothetical protein
MLNPLTMKATRLRDVNPDDLPKNEVSEWVTEQKWLYFLYDNGILSYIGQSVRHPVYRVREHVLEKKKTFNQFSYIKIRQDLSLDIIEKYFIEKYNPKYNIDHRTNLPKPEIDPELLEYYRLKRMTDEELIDMGYSIKRNRIS